MSEELDRRSGRRARLVLTTILAVYGVYYLLRPGHYGLLDHVDLAIHETGHLVFAPFGEFLGMLGGTLFQLLVPAAFVWYFTRRGERYAATVAWWWIAQSCWNVSVYVKDARSQGLPLVGGGEHDWAYLLGALGWVRHDQAIGSLIRLAGGVILVSAVLRGYAYAGRGGNAHLEEDP
ncbi:MAG: hypothetical protein ACREMR_00100 [Gemmatimonadales bacterium]